MKVMAMSKEKTALRERIKEVFGKEIVFAYKVGISKGYLSKLLNGKKNIRSWNCELFAKALKLSVEEFKVLADVKTETTRIVIDLDSDTLRYIKRKGRIEKGIDNQIVKAIVNGSLMEVNE